MNIISEEEYLRRAILRMNNVWPEFHRTLDLDMLEALKAGHRQDVEYLLSQGADPNAYDEKGYHALQLVTTTGCLLTLLEARSDVGGVFPGAGIERLILFHFNNRHESVVNSLMDYNNTHLKQPLCGMAFEPVVSSIQDDCERPGFSLSAVPGFVTNPVAQL